MDDGTIVELALEDIHPYDENPRENELAIEKVTESIAEYGYQSLIIVDKDHVIIAGHTRYEALKRLGYESVKVIVSDMSPEKAAQYRIIDNKSSEFSTWTDSLEDELRKHFSDNADMLDTFFPNFNLDETFPDLMEERPEVLREVEEANKQVAEERERQRERDEARAAREVASPTNDDESARTDRLKAVRDEIVAEDGDEAVERPSAIQVMAVCPECDHEFVVEIGR